MTRDEFYAAVRKSAEEYVWDIVGFVCVAGAMRPLLGARRRGAGRQDPISAVALHARPGVVAMTYGALVATLGLSRGDADVIAWAANATMLGHPVVWAARRRLFEAAGVPLDEAPPAQVKVCQWCLDADMVGVGLSDCPVCRQPICQDHGGPTGTCPTCRGRP